MECMFENVYVDSELMLRQACEKLLKKKQIFWTVVGAILTLLFVLAGAILDRPIYPLCAAVYAALSIWYWLMPYRMAKKSFKNMLKRYDGEIPPTTVQFGEKITFSQSDSYSAIPYEKLKNVVLLKDCILLQDTIGGAYIIANDGFTKGTKQEFLLFLKEKCPTMKLPDWQW